MYFLLFCIVPTFSVSFSGFSKVTLKTTGLNDITYHTVTFEFDSTLTVPSGGYFLSVQYPSDFTLGQSVSICRFYLGADITGCQIQGQEFIIPIQNSSKKYEIEIGDIQNPGKAVQSGDVYLTVYQSVAPKIQIDQQKKTGFKFYEGNLTVLHFEVGSYTAADPNIYKIHLRPDNRIPQGGLFKFKFPFISEIPRDSIIATVEFEENGALIRTETPNVNINSNEIELTGLFNQAYEVTSTSVIKFTLNSIINPAALVQSESIKIYSIISGVNIDKVENGLTVWPTEPCQLTKIRIQPEDQTVQDQSYYTLYFTVYLYMVNNELEIIIPNTIDVTNASIIFGGGFTDSYKSACTKTGQRFYCTKVTTNQYDVVLKIDNVIYPMDSDITDWFQVNIYDGSQNIMCQCAQYTQVQPLPGTITPSNSIIPRPNIVAQGHSFTLDYTITHKATQLYSQTVFIPREQMVADSNLQCEWSNGMTTGPCNYDNSNIDYHILTLTNICQPSCEAATTYMLNFTNAKNPVFVEPSYALSLQIYLHKISAWDIEAKTGLVDLINSNYQFDTLIPKQLSNPVLTRSSRITGENVSVHFKFTIGVNYPANSYIEAKFPQGALFTNTSISCSNLDENSQIIKQTQCAIQASYSDNSINLIRFPSECIDESSCLPDLTVAFGISGIENRYSDKSYTSGYIIKVYSSAGKTIQQGEPDISQLQELQPNTIDYINISRSNHIIYSQTEFTIQFIPKNTILAAGSGISNYITIDLPEQLALYKSTLLCSDGNGNNVVCRNTLTNGSITQIILDNFCITQNCDKGNLITIKFSGCTNPGSVKSLSEALYITTSEKSMHSQLQQLVTSVIDKGNIPDVSQVLPPLVSLPLKNISILPENPTIDIITNYRFIFTVTKTVPQNSYLSITFSNDYHISDGIIGCQPFLSNDSSILCQALGNRIKVYNFISSSITGPVTVGLLVQSIQNFSFPGVSLPFILNISNNLDETIFLDESQTISLYNPIPDDQCTAPCSKCAGSASKCYECQIPSDQPILNGTTCTNQCPSGTVLIEEDLQCYQCHSSCATCKGVQFNDCLSCENGLFFDNGECVSNCPDITVQSNGICKNTTGCTAPCNECTSNPAYCLNCLPGYLHDYISGTCIQNNPNTNDCPEGFYETSSQCLKCDIDCKNCEESADKCTSCKIYFTNSHLLPDTNQCADSCPADISVKVTNNNEIYCENCDNSCQTCDNIGSQGCTSCKSGQFLTSSQTCVQNCPQTQPLQYEGGSVSQCVSECPEGYYSATQTTPEKCLLCPSNCKTCDNQTGDCTDCDYTSPLPYLQQTTCVAECEPQYYKLDDLSNKKCVNSCPDGFLHFENVDGERQCIQTCDGFRYVSGDQCLYCDAQCKACDGVTGKCTSCDIDSPIPFLSDGECLEKCKAGEYQFISQESKECFTNCGENLLHFVDADGERFCIEICDGLRYIAGDQCILCDANCKACDGTTGKCTECDNTENELVLTADGKCVTECPVNYFKSGLLCEQCHETCSICTDAGSASCEKCKTGLLLYENTCIEKCPKGYMQEGQECVIVICPDRACIDCDLADMSICYECRQGFVYYEDICVDRCPEGMFKNQGTCEECNQECLNCSGGKDKCISCPEPKLLHGSTCVDFCPGKSIEKNGKCVEGCLPSCKTCDGEDWEKCTSCLSETEFLYEGKCYKKCPDGSYNDQSKMTCEKCEESCNTCNGPNVNSCTSCREDMFLYNSQECLAECPEGTEKDENNRICLQISKEDTEEDSTSEDSLETSYAPVFILLTLTVLSLLLVLLSKLITPSSHQSLPNLLALFQIVGFAERLMLLVFLILEPQDYADIIFGLDGGFLVGNIVISMFFLLLYLDPLIESNTQLDEFSAQYKGGYCTLYYICMIMGVHVIRLLYGGLFGIKVLSDAKSVQSLPNFRVPLERLALMQLFLITIPIILQELIALILYSYTTNVFQIAAFGIAFHLISAGLYSLFYLKSEWRA